MKVSELWSPRVCAAAGSISIRRGAGGGLLLFVRIYSTKVKVPGRGETLQWNVVIVHDIESSFCVFFFRLSPQPPRFPPICSPPPPPQFRQGKDTGFSGETIPSYRKIEPGENRVLRGTGLRYVTRVTLLLRVSTPPTHGRERVPRP